MMAVGHSLSGWCGGLLTAHALSLPAPLTLIVAGGSAGAALLPDLDHRGSTATTAFGPVSRAAHLLVVAVHLTVAASNRPKGDRGKPPGAHRGVTHWWPCPIVVGAVVAGLCAWSPWAVVAVLTVLYALAIRGLSVPEYRDQQPKRGHWTVRQRVGDARRRMSKRAAHDLAGMLPTIWVLRKLRKWTGRVGKAGVVLVGFGLAVVSLRSGADELGPWLGLLVGGGMVLHILGDGPTESGIPAWRLWDTWQLPKWLAFKAGGAFEVAVVWTSLSIAGVLLLPGVWPAVASAAPPLT